VVRKVRMSTENCVMCGAPNETDSIFRECSVCGYTGSGSYEEYRRISKSSDACPQTQQTCGCLFKYNGGSTPIRTNLICSQNGTIFNLAKPIPFSICDLATSYRLRNMRDSFVVTLH